MTTDDMTPREAADEMSRDYADVAPPPEPQPGQAGMAEVLASVRAVHTLTDDTNDDRPYKVRCACGEWSYVHAAHVDRAGAAAITAWLTGEGAS